MRVSEQVIRERWHHLARGGQFVRSLVPVAVFALALFAMHRLRGEFQLHEVLREFRSIAPGQLSAAIVLAASSYLVLTGYERAALAYVGVRLPWRRYAAASFIAYAIGHNVGIGAVSGAAIRYRLYSAIGLATADIARITAFCAITFGLGLAMLTGVSLLADTRQVANVLHLPVAASTSVGLALFAVVVFYFFVTLRRRAPIAWRRGWQLAVPSTRLALSQVALGSCDLVLSCACVYVLLPGAASGVGFVHFAAMFTIAVASATVSAVPGGLGVFESVLVVLLPSVPSPQLLGALLAYRLVYYGLPFGLALLLLTTQEAARHRESAATSLTRTA